MSDAAPARSRRLLGAVHGQTVLRRHGRQLARTLQEGRIAPEDDGYRIVGLDPVRILLVGGDYAVGHGVGTRHDAIDGALARLVHAETGRGVIVLNRARRELRLRDLTGSLGGTGAATFHLVVFTATHSEATRYLGTRRWRDEVGRLIRRVQHTSSAGVVLLGFPSLTGLQPIAFVARARASQINRALRATADAHTRAVFVEAPPLPAADLKHIDGAAVYSDAAARILPAALHLLGRRALADLSRPAAPVRG